MRPSDRVTVVSRFSHVTCKIEDLRPPTRVTREATATTVQYSTQQSTQCGAHVGRGTCNGERVSSAVRSHVTNVEGVLALKPRQLSQNASTVGFSWHSLYVHVSRWHRKSWMSIPEKFLSESTASTTASTAAQQAKVASRPPRILPPTQAVSDRDGSAKRD